MCCCVCLLARSLPPRSLSNFLSEAAKNYALEHMKQVNSPRGHPIRCFVSDSKTQLLVVGLPPNWSAQQLKVELERIGGPMLGEPQILKPGHAHCNYINYRRAEKALALISGRPCGTTPGGPIMNASLAMGKPPPKIPGAKPPATLFIKNISAIIDEAALAKFFSKYATVTKSTIVRDQLTGESKGFGFVEVGNDEDAAKAQAGGHLQVLEGKVLSVEYAKIPDGSTPPGRALGPGGVRQCTPAQQLQSEHHRKSPSEHRREAFLCVDPRSLIMPFCSLCCSSSHHSHSRSYVEAEGAQVSSPERR